MPNNNVLLRGKLINDPKFHQNGFGKSATAVLQTNEPLFNQSGTKVQEIVTRHNLFIRGEAAENFVAKHKKRDSVEVQGLMTGFKFSDDSKDKGVGYSIEVMSHRSISPDEKSINSHKITGRLGGDPAIKSDGTTIFSVATQDYYTDKFGEVRPMKTEWHNIRVTDPELAQEMSAFKKGAKVNIEGVLESSEYFIRSNEVARTYHITANSISLAPEKNMQGPANSSPTQESIQAAAQKMVKNGELATRALEEMNNVSRDTKKEEPDIDIGM